MGFPMRSPPARSLPRFPADFDWWVSARRRSAQRVPAPYLPALRDCHTGGRCVLPEPATAGMTARERSRRLLLLRIPGDSRRARR